MIFKLLLALSSYGLKTISESRYYSAGMGSRFTWYNCTQWRRRQCARCDLMTFPLTWARLRGGCSYDEYTSSIVPF
eukprot:7440294-Pyramimonas_sp.AAC.2